MKKLAIKKILFPTNFSRGDLKLGPTIADYALFFNAEVTIFHVFCYIQPPDRTRKQFFKRVATIFDRKKVAYQIKEAFGDIVKEICQEAKDGNYDLVILAIEPVGQIRAALGGHKTYAIVRNIPRPLLIIRYIKPKIR